MSGEENGVAVPREYWPAWTRLDVALREKEGVTGMEHLDNAIRVVLGAVDALGARCSELQRQRDEALVAQDRAWVLAERLEATLRQRKVAP